MPRGCEEGDVIEFGPDDFRPLDLFSLRWRWTDPKWDLLPPEELAQIRPLTETRARELWHRTLPTANALFRAAQGEASAGSTTAELFTCFRRIDTISRSHSDVSQELASLVAPGAEPVVAVWEPTDAVVVTWEVLCARWASFCYPASDDVSIRPLDEAWCLDWHHDEYFLFGRPHPLNSAPMSC
jgi:hypothetical protein